MRLISINIWLGNQYAALIQFINIHSQETDIFCFQEVLNNTRGISEFKGFRADILGQISKILPDFKIFYAPRVKFFQYNDEIYEPDITEGTAIFVKNKFKVKGHILKEVLNHRFPKKINNDYTNMPIILQTVELSYDRKPLFINTLHGISMPADKLDTPLRIQQSKNIISELTKQNGKRILTGDFNLFPETQSIYLLEKDLRNLIREFSIHDTRGTINANKGHNIIQNFADYVFVSPEVKVLGFSVPDARVSDHCPMILEFN